MTEDKEPTKTVFDKARDRRAHDVEQLPPELQEKVEQVRQQADQEKTETRTRQAATRDREIAEERSRLHLEHPTMKHVPQFDQAATQRKPSKQDIEKKAEQIVDQRHTRELTAICVDEDNAIDAITVDHANAQEPQIGAAPGAEAKPSEPVHSSESEVSADHDFGSFYVPSGDRDGGLER